MQTRISLFLGAAKSVNAAILGAVELQPQITIAYPFVHGQYFREVEFAALLARVTRWSSNWATYAQGAKLATSLWTQWWQIQLPLGPALNPRAAYSALALGHALLARVRTAPLIPDNADEMDPFVAALRRIEQESGRMIQAQIRLLKDGGQPAAPRRARTDHRSEAAGSRRGLPALPGMACRRRPLGTRLPPPGRQHARAIPCRSTTLRQAEEPEDAPCESSMFRCGGLAVM